MSVSMTSSAAASSMAMAVATTSAASAMASSSMSSASTSTCATSTAAAYLMSLGRLDGGLGLETGLQAGADGHEQVRSDHGLQQQLATGLGEGVAQVRRPSGAR